MADGIAGSVKWRNAPDVALETQMAGKEFPQGHCLATIHADFQRLPWLEFLEQEKPHRVKSVLAKATLIGVEVAAMFLNRLLQEVVKKVNTIEVLFIAGELSPLQIPQGQTLFKIRL